MPDARSEPDPALEVPRYGFLDTYVDGYSVESLLTRIEVAAQAGRRLVIAHHNTHSLALMQSEERLRTLYDRVDTIFIDGMGAVLLPRMLGVDVHADQRVGVLDWIWPLCGRAEAHGWHIVHVGGSESMLAAARQAILARHPDLRLTTIDGYFDPDDPRENRAVLDQIRRCEPQILLIGMGMPRQELWLEENLEALPACVISTVGGIFGFVSGTNPTPPRWTGRLGIEWVFRLVTEPRRLWHRYLVEPLPLLRLVVRQRRLQRTSTT